MKIKKAVITAAARNQNKLPLQTLVDRDGYPKTVLQIIIEEICSAGVEEIAVVICPGDQEPYQTAAGALARQVTFIEQESPLGYGHALYCAREFVGNKPFLHLVSDHLYLSEQVKRCAQQLVEVATTEACTVSAVQATRESFLPYYGAVGGKGVYQRADLFQIEKVIEKPTPTEAEQNLIVPGLRAGHYLCFFGMHVLSTTIMGVLGDLLTETGSPATHLSAALMKMAQRERCLGLRIAGRRYNVGDKYGILNAQLGFALDGQDREEVLAQILEILAQRQTQENLQAPRR